MRSRAVEESDPLLDQTVRADCSVYLVADRLSIEKKVVVETRHFFSEEGDSACHAVTTIFHSPFSHAHVNG